jgi:ParB family transcriptional regulator, chromosome partitioning protein
MKISGIKEIQLSEIAIANSINVRSDLTSANSRENLEELAASIATNGLMQPIVLRGIEGSPPYDVVVGKRRFLAHQLLNTGTIKAVFTGEINNTEAIILSLSENMLRQEMNHTDIMKAVTSLYEEFGKDEKRVQERTGLSLRSIRNYIAIEAQATPELLEMITSKQINLTDAKRVLLSAQGNPGKINSLAIQFKKLTKSEKKRAIDYGVQNPTASSGDIVKQAQTQKVEESLILTFSRKIYAALEKTSNQLHLDKELLVTDLLTEWLKTNDFLNE